ncbi:Hamartin [Trichinella papuae]|uniref:Hamartin n=1 Tax=Trichinella papuae TaxID=268474 RepID=A0A0V1MDC5_9BILA|nr:Hamartin [Trichinella papuae]
MVSGGNSDLNRLLTLIKSTDITASNDACSTLKSIINNGDGIILEICFNDYVKTRCKSTLDVITSVKEPVDKALLECMSSVLKTHPFAVLDILFMIVKKSPVWMQRFPESPFFNNLTKFAKQSNDITFVTGALYVLASLVPLLPSLSAHLNTLFNIFMAAAKLLHKHQNTCIEGLLQKAVMTYCHSLYGLYPCNFISYTRSQFVSQSLNSSQQSLFTKVIRPILKTITLHPLMITSTKAAETIKDRWINKEPHDCFIESADVIVYRMDDSTFDGISAEGAATSNESAQRAFENSTDSVTTPSITHGLHYRGNGGNLARPRHSTSSNRGPYFEEVICFDGELAISHEHTPRLRCQTTPRSEHELLVKRQKAVKQSKKFWNKTVDTSTCTATGSSLPCTPTGLGSSGSFSFGFNNDDCAGTSHSSAVQTPQLQLNPRRSFGSSISKLFRLPQQMRPRSQTTTVRTATVRKTTPQGNTAPQGEFTCPNVIQLSERDADALALLKKAGTEPTEIAEEANEEDCVPELAQLNVTSGQSPKEPNIITAELPHCSSISSSTGNVFSGKSSSFFGPHHRMHSITSAGQQQQQQQQQQVRKQTQLTSLNCPAFDSAVTTTRSSLLAKAEHVKNQDKAEKRLPGFMQKRFSSSCPNLTAITGDKTALNSAMLKALCSMSLFFPGFSPQFIEQQQQKLQQQQQLEINNKVGEKGSVFYIHLAEEKYVDLSVQLHLKIIQRSSNVEKKSPDVVAQKSGETEPSSDELDEISILKTKAELLECELKLEQCRREQHAKRNRHLHERIKHMTSLEQHLQSKMIQVRWLFHERSMINEFVTKLEDENLRNTDAFIEKEKTWLKKYTQLKQENRILKNDIELIKRRIGSMNEKKQKLIQQLEKSKQELKEIQLQAKQCEMTAQSSALREKGLLLTVQKLQDRICNLTEQCTEMENLELELLKSKKRLADVECIAQEQRKQIDQLEEEPGKLSEKHKAALDEAEALRLQIIEKDRCIEDLRFQLAKRRELHCEKIGEMRKKCTELCNVSIKKEWQILDLHKRFTMATIDRSRAATASTSTSSSSSKADRTRNLITIPQRMARFPESISAEDSFTDDDTDNMTDLLSTLSKLTAEFKNIPPPATERSDSFH